MTVKTSDIPFAGTDAKVFIKLQGRSGDDSDDLPLKKSGKDLFEQNQTDVFVFEDIPSVGEITHVKVWHDNSGKVLSQTVIKEMQRPLKRYIKRDLKRPNFSSLILPTLCMLVLGITYVDLPCKVNAIYQFRKFV